MFLVDGEWLDHGDPRVDALWINRLTGASVPREHRTDEEYSTLNHCRALVPDYEAIEMAASYPEDDYGCIAARSFYGTPVTRRNLTHLNDSEA